MLHLFIILANVILSDYLIQTVIVGGGLATFFSRVAY